MGWELHGQTSSTRSLCIHDHSPGCRWQTILFKRQRYTTSIILLILNRFDQSQLIRDQNQQHISALSLVS